MHSVKGHVLSQPTVIIALLLIGLICIQDVTSERQVIKRSDDSDPLAVVVNRLSQELAEVKADIQSLKNTRVTETQAAFLVNPGSSPLNVTADKPVKFSNEVLDIGQCYSPALGMFSPPVPGVYILSVQIYPYLSQDHTVYLYKNGVSLVLMRVYDQSVETSEATSVVVHAVPGDHFWVQMNHGTWIHSGPYSFFSGALIARDP